MALYRLSSVKFAPSKWVSRPPPIALSNRSTGQRRRAFSGTPTIHRSRSSNLPFTISGFLERTIFRRAIAKRIDRADRILNQLLTGIKDALGKELPEDSSAETILLRGRALSYILEENLSFFQNLVLVQEANQLMRQRYQTHAGTFSHGYLDQAQGWVHSILSSVQLKNITAPVEEVSRDIPLSEFKEFLLQGDPKVFLVAEPNRKNPRAIDQQTFIKALGEYTWPEDASYTLGEMVDSILSPPKIIYIKSNLSVEQTLREVLKTTNELDNPLLCSIMLTENGSSRGKILGTVHFPALIYEAAKLQYPSHSMIHQLVLWCERHLWRGLVQRLKDQNENQYNLLEINLRRFLHLTHKTKHPLRKVFDRAKEVYNCFSQHQPLFDYVVHIRNANSHFARIHFPYAVKPGNDFVALMDSLTEKVINPPLLEFFDNPQVPILEDFDMSLYGLMMKIIDKKRFYALFCTPQGRYSAFSLIAIKTWIETRYKTGKESLEHFSPRAFQASALHKTRVLIRGPNFGFQDALKVCARRTKETIGNLVFVITANGSSTGRYQGSVSDLELHAKLKAMEISIEERKVPHTLQKHAN